MHQTSPRLCGRLNNSGVDANISCEHILGYPASKVVRTTRSLAHISTNRYLDLEAPTRPPLTVKFEIPYFTVSGIQVRYLKIVEKSGYQALPWVRYITQNGDDYRWASLLLFFSVSCPILHYNATLGYFSCSSMLKLQSQSPYSSRKRQRATRHADMRCGL